MYPILWILPIKKINGFLLTLDIKKAFDSVSWEFLFQSLQWCNYGHSLINLVKVLYNNAKACVINNEFTTNYFCLRRGVQQGDQISPYLFNIIIEVLALNILNIKRIKGLESKKINIKICQYADNAIFFSSDIDSIKESIRMINNFNVIFRLKLNLNKTQSMSLGIYAGLKDIDLHNMEIIINNKIAILSIIYSNSNENIKLTLLKWRNAAIKPWYIRSLTVYGRILLDLQCVGQVFISPSQLLHDIQHIMKFVLKGKNVVKLKILFCIKVLIQRV